MRIITVIDRIDVTLPIEVTLERATAKKCRKKGNYKLPFFMYAT